jgi:putative redox protein
MIKYFAKTQFIAENQFETEINGKKVILDTGSGVNKYQSPVEVLLSALASCSAIDVIEILRKKRKTVEDFKIEINADRRTEPFPKVLTEIHAKFIIKSPDTEEADLKQAVELSMDKYCSVAGMLNKAAEITYSWEIR